MTLVLAALAGCKDHKDAQPAHTGDTSAGEQFTVLGDADTLPAAAILSIWGTSHEDVFLVGADDDTGPVVLHYDGVAWARLDTGTTGDLWWVSGVPGADAVWMSGAAGRVLTYSRSAGTFTEEQAADPTYTMFGVWGTSDTDRWAVGADINSGLDGIVVHDDGTGWTTSWLIPPAPDTSKRGAFKIWGSGPDDVYVVGTNALVGHWDGETWEDFPYMGYKRNIYFTVHGSGPDELYVVGGESNAVVVSWNGAEWGDLTPPTTDFVPVVNGVWSTTDHGTVICGGYGSILWKTPEDTWEFDPRNTGTSRDFHACWIDENGDAWAVGGDINSSLVEGVVVYGGDQVPPITGL